MRYLIAAVLLVQAAPAQSEADKLEAALKKFGDRRFRIMEKGKETGTLTLKTEFEVKEGKKVVSFEDRVEMKAGEFSQTLAITEQAALNGLRLQWTLRMHQGPSREADYSIQLRETDAYVVADRRQLIIRDAKGVIGEQAILRLVCAKEQEVGASFTTKRLILEPIDYQESRTVRCVAKESLAVGGRKIEAFKWEDKWEGKSALGGEEVPVKIDNAYWVGPDGFLVRFRLGNTEMILDAK